jgi:hypothetical protein
MPVANTITVEGSGAKGMIVFSDLREFVAALQEADVPADSTFEVDFRLRGSRLTKLTLRPPLDR